MKKPLVIQGYSEIVEIFLPSHPPPQRYKLAKIPSLLSTVLSQLLRKVSYPSLVIAAAVLPQMPHMDFG